MDFKSSFLHGDLYEEIYMDQPLNFIQDDSSLVCFLNNSLYGLKEAPHAWISKMDIFLLDTIFSRCNFDNNVYTKRVDGHLIILVIYVDDLILTGSDPKLINHVKSQLKKKFDMTNFGYLHYFLGLQVLRSKEVISLSHSKYAYDLLCHIQMEYSKPTPSSFHSRVKLSLTCTSPKVSSCIHFHEDPYICEVYKTLAHGRCLRSCH